MMSPPYQPPRQTWKRKFQCAFQGIGLGVWRQSSFAVHSLCFAAVVVSAAFFQVEAWEWVALLLASALVLCAELINSALESLAKSVTDQFCPNIDQALKVASGAVLLAAIFAVVIGLIIFLPHVTNWSGSG